MHALSQDIYSEDGVANAAIAEAAERLEELQKQLKEAKDYADRLVQHKDMVCLPKDLELLREANLHFATENQQLKDKIRDMNNSVNAIKDKHITVNVTNHTRLNSALSLTLNWDANLDDWTTAFKTILTHQTFDEESIKEMFTETATPLTYE